MQRARGDTLASLGEASAAISEPPFREASPAAPSGFACSDHIGDGGTVRGGAGQRLEGSAWVG